MMLRNLVVCLSLRLSIGFYMSIVTSNILKTHESALFGILEEIESDSYDLMKTPDNSGVNMNNAYEMFLAELVFSTNDPRSDIANKIELAGDAEFMSWLEDKIGSSSDPQERLALKDLYEMIRDIKTRLEVNKLAEMQNERAPAEADDAPEVPESHVPMSSADVLKRASRLQSAAKNEDKKNYPAQAGSFYEAQLTPEIRLSYENLLKTVLPPYQAGDSCASIVARLYDQFDAQFVKVLNERAFNGDEDAKALLEALAVEQQKRIAKASETLKLVLSKGELMRMEGAIVTFAREGRIDEPFMLLLEANENQAREAGAIAPADLMLKLRQRAMEEKDKQSTSKEVRLLRQLLRTESASERESLLELAFTPKDALIVPGTAENAARAVDGELPEQQQPLPEVPPPDFINACKAVLLNFGNLGSYDYQKGDLSSRIKKLAAEAEVVATRIYGKGTTVREQQDRMWKDQTTSIFDLERMEIEAERNGETAPWADPTGESDIIPGFVDGRMQVGGD